MTEDLTEVQKIVMWCEGAINQLIDWGFLNSNSDDYLTGKGHETFLNLQEIGWKPTDKQLESYANYAQLGVILKILKKYRDDPQKLKSLADHK